MSAVDKYDHPARRAEDGRVITRHNIINLGLFGAFVAFWIAFGHGI